jgi:hypothetical protein
VSTLLTRLVVLIAPALIALPAAAVAQDAPRGYLEGMWSVARTVETDSAYAGLGAWRLTKRVHIFGEVGRLRNALGGDLPDRLAAIEERIRANNESAFHDEFAIVFEALVPTWYGLGGVRVAGPSAGRLSTYIEAGSGAARLDPQVHLTINGEALDAEAAAITGLGNGRQQLEFIAGGGAGMAFQGWKRIRVEAGYRFMRVFGDAKTNISRVHVGAGWSF